MDFDPTLCRADDDNIRARLRRVHADGSIDVRMVIVENGGAATGQWLPVPTAAARPAP